jgi:formylglycine-generating enzyme required for sulfatase activity
MNSGKTSSARCSFFDETVEKDENLWVHQTGAAVNHSSNRVNRGGSWNNNARNCRSANRNNNDPDNRNNDLGFRILSALSCQNCIVQG